ncbi:hypothetical protein [Actinoplanes couchii]|uniref:Uncharacterized protein n=1 Tax=Actinoplanes couchii TaxID=403638 RepID=A0ABQ3XKG3_9ACTN|nr:hypothetical protein [Actinoplanes couchii]MDR6320591.1 hypothetical protein [Actinoplanes couchii]GID58994.1 hypothetical protein Aco03nite_073980 [Actinoplanes couchii]
MPELERSYRRWLWAYPAFYRRERGLEILTTLLDSAGPGQTRPSRGEVAYLLLMGLKYRFVPAHWTGAIATVLVAVWVALVLGGGGALAVWAAADPQKPDLAVLSDTLAGQAPTSVDGALGDGLLDTSITYQAAGVFQTFGLEGWSGSFPAPFGETRFYDGVAAGPAVVTDAHRSLAAAGWTTGELRPSPSGAETDQVFWAQRGGVLIRVAGVGDRTAVEIGAFPVEPGGVPAGAIAGFAIGLVVTWQLMTAATHRIARTPWSTRRLILLIGLPGLAACAANSVDSVLSMVPDLDAIIDSAGVPGRVLMAVDYMYPLASQLAAPLAVGIIAISAMCCAALLSTAGQLWPGSAVPQAVPQVVPQVEEG